MQHSGLALLVFCGLLMVLEIQGSTRDRLHRSTLMNDCVKEAVPLQVYNQCCVQERNCSVTRKRNQGYECIARMILENVTSSGEDWRSLNSEYTSSSREERRNGFSHNILRAADYCVTLGREDQQRICLREEMMKMCRNNSGRYHPPGMGFSRSPYDDSRSSSFWTFGTARWMHTTRNPLNRFGERNQRTDYYGDQSSHGGAFYPSVSRSRPLGSHVTYGYQDNPRDGQTSSGYPLLGRVQPSSSDRWHSWSGDETAQGQISGYDSSDYEHRRT